MADPNAPIHSTGRGGAGNIGPDSRIYTDGGIIREGVQGESVDGSYSTGRGGAGNVTGSPRVNPQGGLPEGRRSQDYIPENALREPHENFHAGRGGAGNAHKEHKEGHGSPHLGAEKKHGGVGDKIKHALHLDGKEKKNEGI